MKTARAISIGHYIITHNITIRQASIVFGISKSSVHKDVSYKLKNIDHALYQKVKTVLEHNLAVRHIRGGEATKQKYLNAIKK